MTTHANWIVMAWPLTMHLWPTCSGWTIGCTHWDLILWASSIETSIGRKHWYLKGRPVEVQSVNAGDGKPNSWWEVSVDSNLITTMVFIKVTNSHMAHDNSLWLFDIIVHYCLLTSIVSGLNKKQQWLLILIIPAGPGARSCRHICHWFRTYCHASPCFHL